MLSDDVTYRAFLAVGVPIMAAALVMIFLTVDGTPPHEHNPEVHRATTEYRDLPCEEDEVAWWVEDGVRACTPLDDMKGHSSDHAGSVQVSPAHQRWHTGR